MAACHYVNNCCCSYNYSNPSWIPARFKSQLDPGFLWTCFFSIAFITCLPWNVQQQWFLPCEILCNINLGLWVIVINPLVVHSNLQAIWIGTSILFLLLFPLLYSLTTLLFNHHSTLLLFPLSPLYHEIWNFDDTWKFYHIICSCKHFHTWLSERQLYNVMLTT